MIRQTIAMQLSPHLRCKRVWSMIDIQLIGKIEHGLATAFSKNSLEKVRSYGRLHLDQHDVTGTGNKYRYSPPASTTSAPGSSGCLYRSCSLLTFTADGGVMTRF